MFGFVPVFKANAILSLCRAPANAGILWWFISSLQVCNVPGGPVGCTFTVSDPSGSNASDQGTL